MTSEEDWARALKTTGFETGGGTRRRGVQDTAAFGAFRNTLMGYRLWLIDECEEVEKAKEVALPILQGRERGVGGLGAGGAEGPVTGRKEARDADSEGLG